MRRIGIFVLDLLFTCGSLGLIIVILWIVSAFLHRLTGQAMQRELLPTYGNQFFWWTVILWIGLTGLMLIDCYGNARFDDFKSNLWTRILLIEIFVIGPMAYYLGSFRARALQETGPTSFALVKKRFFLDTLYLLSFWGSVAVLLSGVAIVVFTHSVQSFKFLLTVTLLLIPLSAIPSAMLSVILLIDAVQRPKEEWERINFLKLLNPWSWVFGMRRYYLHVLRPELVSGGARKA